MRDLSRPALVGTATLVAAVAVAALLAHHPGGGRTNELPAFAVWSLPLALIAAVYTRRPRLARLPQLGRAVATAVLGLSAGVALTAAGWLLVGGWMLAWDFPVLYCWSAAGAAGLLLAGAASGAFGAQAALVGVGTAVLPIAVLAWVGSRPTRGVLIVYRDAPGRDVAQAVLDSVLTEPHLSGQGRDMRWEVGTYVRVRTADGRTAALLEFRGGNRGAEVRRALAGNPHVLAIRDTVLPN